VGVMRRNLHLDRFAMIRKLSTIQPLMKRSAP
jgi:hypothetical protein